MPFSSLSDPADVARAHGALEQAWMKVAALYPDQKRATTERERLAYIVASFALIAIDEEDRVDRAVTKSLNTV